jgi:septal ring factor EnvC (AmiA/AmiB activator)
MNSEIKLIEDKLKDLKQERLDIQDRKYSLDMQINNLEETLKIIQTQ